MKRIVYFVMLEFCVMAFLHAQPNKILISSGFNYESNQKIKVQSMKNFSDDKEDIFNYKGENIIRRAEVLFFGSMTFSTFIGWMLFSAYNTILHDQTFGKLERYQFFTLYLGGAVLSLSVSVTDLVVRLRPKMKRVVL